MSQTTKNNINEIPQWVRLNNQIVDENGDVKDIDKDKEAALSYLESYVKKNTMNFKTLEEKLSFLIENDYYEEGFLKKYTLDQLQKIYDIAYSYNHQFPSYMGAFKFYNDYALKTDDKRTFLETFEDRMVVNALVHAEGDFSKAKRILHSLMRQDFTPATPTLLNTGKKRRGEMVSCFLLEINDSLNDISRSSEFGKQLSKLGGGVSFEMSNIRAKGESVKNIPHVAKGVVGVLKLLDNDFRYADQMGQRPGAGVGYLNVFHADIFDFLDTKKLTADDDVRVKTLSLGVVVPDKMIELARKNKDMYVFYPHTVQKEYGIPFADIAIDMDKWYDKLIKNPNVRKRKVNARKLLETIAIVQGECGYPYIMFADNVNRANPLADFVKFSNLCTEILQPSKVSTYADYHEREKDEIGQDISCILSSGNILNMIENKTIKETVYSAMDVMNSVSDKTDIKHIPGVAKANKMMRSVGLGMMNLHGFLAKNYISYGSQESIEFVDVFFNAVNFYSLKYSMEKAKETGSAFYGFESSKYADGTYFEDKGSIYPTSEKITSIFESIHLPTPQEWEKLQKDVMKYGLYNSHRLAIAPNGSTAYFMSATPSCTPIKQLVEERTYGNSKTYFPAPYLKEAGFMYETAYSMDKFKIIDVISTIQKHVDQGISLEICIDSSLTTRELQRIYLYAHSKGIKTLYYTRTRKLKINTCESCVA